ncbi:hypothetical protein D3C80_1562510 [compost metagenome]
MLHFGTRKRIQEILPVISFDDPGIIYNDDSPVLGRPNQPAKTLLETDDRLRNRQLHERILLLGLEQLRLRLRERMVRRLKRKSDDRQAGQRLSRNIHTFPEAAGPEQHRSRAVLEPPDQLAAAASLHSLAKDRNVL